MNIMQYKITLPSDYNMEIIKQRVAHNGNKTDGFIGLLLKAYLISDDTNQKEYAPLYVWNDYSGMNCFIFGGFYDNILHSFGWQNIDIYIPLQVNLSMQVKSAKYILEITHAIKEKNNMTLPTFSIENNHCLGKFLMYNPSTWKSVEFHFLTEVCDELKVLGRVYQILHLSM